MKKLVPIICAVLVLVSLSGCSSILGGMNRREIGEYTYLQSDGEKQYFYYDGQVLLEDGYVVIDGSEYSLSEGVLPASVITPLETESEVVLTSYKSALYGSFTCPKEYDPLGCQLEDIFGGADDDKYYEALLLKKDENIFGAVNVYSRVSGRSGNLLTNEQLVKSCFVTVNDDELTVAYEFEDTAILAFNDTHALTYKDKKIYSKDLQNGTEVFICKDEWWDRGPTFYNEFFVTFTDDYFLIYADKGRSVSNSVSLMAGKIDGSEFNVLVDDKFVVF